MKSAGSRHIFGPVQRLEFNVQFKPLRKLDFAVAKKNIFNNSQNIIFLVPKFSETWEVTTDNLYLFLQCN
jgi:hypothetical protein